MENKIQKIVSLCKRRGFIFPSSEIYGGFQGVYDFGPLGVELKKNIKKAWWDEMTKKQNGIVGLDSAILMNPKVWQASGHLEAGFSDELVECKKCHHRFREDFLEKNKCPDCGGELTEARKFNLMMKTFAGPVEKEASEVYLRAETAQGIYVNFKNVLDSTRTKLPFGICQIGKSFRNEITPRNFIFRTREFEQMEMQWFCQPKEAEEYFEYWKKERIKWYTDLGIKKENLRIKEVPENDRPHYARQALDLEYYFPFGWDEIEGIHNRGDFDLSNHSEHSGQDLRYQDKKTDKKYFPFIIETSSGVDRSLLAFLSEAYQEVKGGRTKTTKSIKDKEVLLKLNKKLSPIKVAVLPLLRNKPKLVKKAKGIYFEVKRHFVSQYDEAGSIGRRYRRQDESGTVFAVTVDFDTLKDDTVTLRDRDTMKQERVEIGKLIKILKENLKN